MSLTQLGRYKITGTLGRGAMGTVYQAHDPLIEREVAIKAISCAGLTREESDEFEQRFFREAKSAGRLNHPNIVTIHDVGRSGDLSYIAMEFLVGRSLRDILDTHVALPVTRIVQIAAEIADGLSFAHANGIVHRDIKPSNIMVLDNGTVKITDFGIAQLPSSSLTLVGTAMGTPKYMSPEQINGRKADGRSDIFSLGAVLYEMLTGRAPFSGAELNAILYQVLNAAPPLPSTIHPALPAGFDRIVARAMAKEPDKRYLNADEFAADLRRVHTLPGLMQIPVETPATSLAEAKPVATAPERSTPGRRRLWAYGATLALMAAVAIGWSFWLRRADSPIPAIPDNRPSAEAPRAAAPVVKDVPPQDVETSSTHKTAAANETDRKPDTRKTRKSVRETAGVKNQAPSSETTTTAGDSTAARSGGWQAALRADLRECDNVPFFRRILCIDKARRQYCPGHWNEVSECSVQSGTH